MNITFKKGIGVEPWTLEDSRITYPNSGVVITFEDIIDFLVLSEPDKREKGEIQLLTQDGRVHTVIVLPKQKEYWGEALNHIETHIRKRGLKKDANVDGILYNIAGLKNAAGKSLTVFEDKIVLKATSNIAAYRIDGEKTIYYADCIGVQFKEVSTMNPGYLQLETASALINNQENPLANENTFVFAGRVLNAHMREIADYILAKVEACKGQKNGQAAPISAADELKKFKELLDSGVITQEEFDAKKKQLLGL